MRVLNGSDRRPRRREVARLIGVRNRPIWRVTFLKEGIFRRDIFGIVGRRGATRFLPQGQREKPKARNRFTFISPPTRVRVSQPIP
jgi:hypothetical protein